MSEKLFTKEEVIDQLEQLVRSSGYEKTPAPIEKEFMTKPEIYANKEDHKVAIFVVSSPEELERMLAKMRTVRFELGRDLDYAVALPSVDEKHLIDSLAAKKDKLYKIIKKDKYTVWLCNPEENTIKSYFNMPQDKELSNRLDDQGDIVLEHRRENERKRKEEV
jgi:hypothetical protein